MLLRNAAQNNPVFIKIAQYAAPTPPNTPFLSLVPLQGGGRSGRVGRVRGSDLTLLAIFLDPSFAQLAENTAISICGPYSHSRGAFILVLGLVSGLNVHSADRNVQGDRGST